MAAITLGLQSFQVPRFRVSVPPPELSFQAVPLLNKLRDALQLSSRLLGEFAKRRSTAQSRQSKWGEPALFFFDKTAQEELLRARATPLKFPQPDLVEVAERMPLAAEAFAALPSLLDDALTLLPASLECRRVARATEGLIAAAEMVGKHVSAAREVAEMLQVIDDEVILVVDLERHNAARVLLTGVVDVYQLMVLLNEVLPNRRRMDRRIVAAYRNSDPDPDATVARAPFQLLRAEALQADGAVRPGFESSDFWLWGPELLHTLPREHGERVILIAPQTVQPSWDVGRRYPKLPAEVKLVETLPRIGFAAWLRSRCPEWRDLQPQTVRGRAA